MTEFEWTESDDEMLAIQPLGRHHPVNVANTFVEALRNYTKYPHIPPALVTPESEEYWGDFQAHARRLAAIEHFGISQTVKLAHGCPDVAYARILTDHGGSLARHTTETLVTGVLILTLVWRPEHDYWLAHQLGEYAHPDIVPRTSPGVAPFFDIGMAR